MTARSPSAGIADPFLSQQPAGARHQTGVGEWTPREPRDPEREERGGDQLRRATPVHGSSPGSRRSPRRRSGPPAPGRGPSAARARQPAPGAWRQPGPRPRCAVPATILGTACACTRIDAATAQSWAARQSSTAASSSPWSANHRTTRWCAAPVLWVSSVDSCRRAADRRSGWQRIEPSGSRRTSPVAAMVQSMARRVPGPEHGPDHTRLAPPRRRSSTPGGGVRGRRAGQDLVRQVVLDLLIGRRQGGRQVPCRGQRHGGAADTARPARRVVCHRGHGRPVSGAVRQPEHARNLAGVHHELGVADPDQLAGGQEPVHVQCWLRLAEHDQAQGPTGVVEHDLELRSELARRAGGIPVEHHRPRSAVSQCLARARRGRGSGLGPPQGLRAPVGCVARPPPAGLDAGASTPGPGPRHPGRGSARPALAGRSDRRPTRRHPGSSRRRSDADTRVTIPPTPASRSWLRPRRGSVQAGTTGTPRGRATPLRPRTQQSQGS